MLYPVAIGLAQGQWRKTARHASDSLMERLIEAGMPDLRFAGAAIFVPIDEDQNDDRSLR